MQLLFKIRTIILSLFILLCAQTVSGRELTLENFQLLTHDISARTDMREDYNGDKCAMIKISLPIEGCRFEGGVVDSKYDVNEYRLHVVAGTKKIRIKCPGFETLEVVFSEHSDIKTLESLSTYAMRIGGYEAMVGNEAKDPGVNYLIMYIDPEDIPGLTVKVNNEIRQVEDGEVALCLPYGEYSYLIEAPGYRPEKGKVNITKGERGTVGISLQPTEDQTPREGQLSEEDSAISATHSRLTVRSELPGARIRVNQRDRADGWSGSLEPGSYVIEATKEGFRPFSETITLSPNETREFVIPELIPILGAVDVSYRPSGATIFIDGNGYGETPAIVNNIPAGYHTVIISKKGYNSQTWENVLVKEGEIFRLTGSLEKSPVVIIEEDYTPPTYPGGMDSMWHFLQSKLKIPSDTPAGRHEIPFQLKIDAKGNIQNIDIVESVEEIKDLENECIKIFQKMPRFKPALRNGQPEESVYTITIPVQVSK
ncbi:MAG: PEGA domain-containing protein [Muribaculaceae bacterium]|nr:PEGA domain-containing protein [Muribaculaceae bacterium]